MPTEIQRRGGTSAENATFTGLEREITIDTDKNTVVVHDGATLGGFPLAHEDHIHPMSDIGSGSGVIELTEGGTGATSASAALVTLGAAEIAHTHSTLTGYGDLVFVDTDLDFQAAYSGLPKTIILAAGLYTTPATFIPGINLVRLGGLDEGTKLAGNMTINASSASVVRTSFEGFHIHGDLNFGTLFDGIVDMKYMHHHNGTVTFDSPSGKLYANHSEVDKFFLVDGYNEYTSCQITGGGSVQNGGTLEFFNTEVEIDTIEDVLTMNGGTLVIDGFIYENLSGNGIVMNSGKATINSMIESTPGGGNPITINGSPTESIMHLGTHNLNPATDIIQNGGTLFSLIRSVAPDAVDVAGIQDSAVETNAIADNAVTLDKMDIISRVQSFQGSIPVITGGESEVIIPFVIPPGMILRTLRIQGRNTTTATVPVTVQKHGARGLGVAFNASSVQLGASVIVSGLLEAEIFDEAILPGEAISLSFGAVSGSSQIEEILWATHYAPGGL